MSSLEVVVAQSPAELDGPEARFEWLKESLNLEIIQGADLLLLPELFLTGYNIGSKVKAWSETVDGFYAQKIKALCQKHDIAIHYGYSESECSEGDASEVDISSNASSQNHCSDENGNKIYNSASCISRDGIKLGGHRKLLLPPGFEGDHFSCGDSFETFTINGFNIGTLICYDAEFPENFRHVAQQGVDLILVPTALSSLWGIVAHNVIPTRAFENGVFVCYANQAGNEHGLEYLGASCIVGPDGSELKRADDESEFLRATLTQTNVTEAQQRLPYLQDMRRLSNLIISHKT
ncbi:MAG: putative amidohydrolase [Cocleimonas sp.]|jgi:predicted amidohydrolase